jgi:hypothetical protein
VLTWLDEATQTSERRRIARAVDADASTGTEHLRVPILNKPLSGYGGRWEAQKSPNKPDLAVLKMLQR